MSDTVILIFKATSATLHTGFSKELSNTPSISYRLEHERRQKVSTASGVDLTDLEWTMQVNAMDKFNDYAEKEGGIGVMSYWGRDEDEDGRCYISVAIGEATFERLFGAGGIPTQIMVHVRGLEYGKDYEGADKIWPLANKGSIVTEVAFSVAMGEALEDTTNIDVTRKNDEFAVAQQVLKPLYVIAIAVVLIVLRLYFR
jgi:hypothetical protein